MEESYRAKTVMVTYEEIIGRDNYIFYWKAEYLNANPTVLSSIEAEIGTKLETWSEILCTAAKSKKRTSYEVHELGKLKCTAMKMPFTCTHSGSSRSLADGDREGISVQIEASTDNRWQGQATTLLASWHWSVCIEMRGIKRPLKTLNCPSGSSKHPSQISPRSIRG